MGDIQVKKQFVFLISGLLILTLALAGCGGGSGDTNPGGDPPATPSAELSGYVYYADEDGTQILRINTANYGTAITNTDITITLSINDTPYTATAKTDANGHFLLSISDLADGVYEGTLTVTGYGTTMFATWIESGKTKKFGGLT